MPTVDFIYDSDCPNIGSARANLMRAFGRAGVQARWQEHRIGDPDAPERARGFGSPTILVDGRDVAGLEPAEEACCRVYAVGNATAGAPAIDQIAAALQSAKRNDNTTTTAAPPARPTRMRSVLAVLPGLGVALMPKVVCPLCWPAYAGVLSAVGLTFLMQDEWLLPISALCLLAAVAALSWRARQRRGYGPAMAGLLASLAILTGKFAMQSDLAIYTGIAGLIAACTWNAWPRRKAAGSCAACISHTQPEP
jgi:mercuric ion transport protein